MDFFDTVETRRSTRRYTEKPVPESVMEKAFDAALKAPNSSNMQTWEFFWIRSPEKKRKVVDACLNQGAAKTAQELVVITSNRKNWKRSRKEMLKLIDDEKINKFAHPYYKKVMPLFYGFEYLAPFKWLLFNGLGQFKPTPRGPWTPKDIDFICMKSAALACENFMLAITAQGFDTCPMEGFDERRLKKALNLSWHHRICMVISVGERDPKGIWGERIRFPREWTIKEV